MKPLSAFYPYILPFVPGCPDPVADRAIVDGAIEFCRASRVLIETLDPIDTVAGQSEYDLQPTDPQNVVSQVVRAWYLDQELTPVSDDNVGNVLAFRGTVGSLTADASSPQVMFEPSLRVLGVYPVPTVSETGAISVRAVLVPARAATSLADELYEDWPEAIANAALKRIKQIPNQPYSDLVGAENRMKMLESNINEARNRRETGVVRAPLQVTLRGF